MMVLCSPQTMADVLMMPLALIERKTQQGTFVADHQGRYCFSSTVQRHLVDLQRRAGHGGGDAAVINPVELDGLTEEIVKQQVSEIKGDTQVLDIVLPDDLDLEGLLDE